MANPRFCHDFNRSIHTCTIFESLDTFIPSRSYAEILKLYDPLSTHSYDKRLDLSYHAEFNPKQQKTRLSFHTSSSVFPSRRRRTFDTGYDDWCTLFNIARKQTRIRVTRTAEKKRKKRKRKRTTRRAIEFRAKSAVSSFSTSNDQPPSLSSSLPSFSRPVERVQVEAKVKPEESSPAKEVVRVLGSTLKLTPRALARFLSSLRVGGGGSAARPRRNTGCVFRCAITMAVCILITRHRARLLLLLLSSIPRETLASRRRINGGRERAQRTPEWRESREALIRGYVQQTRFFSRMTSAAAIIFLC